MAAGLFFAGFVLSRADVLGLQAIPSACCSAAAIKVKSKA
jgi:hypothetical protein